MDPEKGLNDRQRGGRSAIPDPELLELDRYAALGSLMGSIVHETLNPLAAALNLAMLIGELLRTRPYARAEVGDLQKHLDDLAGEVRRACGILSQVQEFARAGDARCVPCDLNRLVEETLALSRHRTKLECVPVETHMAERLPAVRCRPSQIRQVILGFLAHAGPGAGARGGIELTTGLTDEGKAAFVEVRGAANESAAAALAMEATDRIARGHGGRMERESGPGERVAMRLILPVGDDSDERALGDPGSRR